MSDLQVDDDLVPPVYHAWAHWERGERERSLRLLTADLESRLGVPALDPWEGLLRSDAHVRFAALIARLLAQPGRLQVEPARLAESLWRQAPRMEVLSAIVLGDLRWSDDPFVAEPEATPGADELADLLQKHIEVGLISLDPRDLPYGGRPVLSDDLLAASDPLKLGAVHAALSARPDRRPAREWWETAVDRAPRMVVRNLVQDLFGSSIAGPKEPSAVWSRIRSWHHDYAWAARAALDALHDAVSLADWTELGRVVGRTDSPDFHALLARVVSVDT